MSDAASTEHDPGSIMRERSYHGLLVIAALVGLLVSVSSWAFLEAVHYAQVWLFEDLPGELGFATVPLWWPLPLLAVAGGVVAFAVTRLPGNGGHEPSEGLKGGLTLPVDLPGVVLAAFGTLALGMVLGPEAPLIALGSGLGVLSIRLARRDAPDRAVGVIAAAGSFAAVASIFGSPIIGAIIIIEAAGLGGATLPVVLLPGLLAAGIGSLVFVGMGSLTGLSTSAYSIAVLDLPTYPRPDLAAFGWTILLALAAALVVFAVIRVGRATRALVVRRPFLVIPAAAIAVGLLAIAFFEITGEAASLVLFSGQEAMSPLVQQAGALSVGTLAILLALKGVAWGLSLGAGRGGPTFPAMFLGIVGGLLVANLPGFAETPGVAILIGAACVAVLRLPLSSIVIAVIISGASVGSGPLIIVAVVVAYLATVGLNARFSPKESEVPARSLATDRAAQSFNRTGEGPVSPPGPSP